MKLLAAGLAGPTLMVTVFLIDGATRPGYNPWHQWVSHLSLGERGWMGTANLLVSGLLIVCFAAGLRLTLRSGKGSVGGPVLAGGFGLGLILAAVFPIDPGLGYPPGAAPAAGPSLTHMIHNLAGLIAFGSLIGLCFVMARRFRGVPGWEGWALYATITGFTVAAAYMATSVLTGLEYGGIFPDAPSGLMERVALIAGCAWMAILSQNLIRHPEVGSE